MRKSWRESEIVFLKDEDAKEMDLKVKFMNDLIDIINIKNVLRDKLVRLWF